MSHWAGENSERHLKTKTFLWLRLLVSLSKARKLRSFPGKLKIESPILVSRFAFRNLPALIGHVCACQKQACIYICAVPGSEKKKRSDVNVRGIMHESSSIFDAKELLIWIWFASTAQRSAKSKALFGVDFKVRLGTVWRWRQLRVVGIFCEFRCLLSFLRMEV
jgi:hypothetical protein